MTHYILGIDPGFASVGYAVVALGDVPTNDHPVRMGVVRTQKANEKRKVRASEDNLERAKEIAKEIQTILTLYPTSLICAETMSYPRNSAAAAKMAICWGILAAVAQQRGIAITQASPQEVKKAVCGKKDASKDEVKAAMNAMFPAELTGSMGLCANIPASVQEHPYDALAAVLACRDSEVFLLARRMATCAASTG
mgnify:CR=1 FL=1